MVRTAVFDLDVMRLLLNPGFQVLFVRQDVSVPLGDGLMLTHPDLLSNLGNQKGGNEARARETSAFPPFARRR